MSTPRPSSPDLAALCIESPRAAAAVADAVASTVAVADRTRDTLRRIRLRGAK